METPGAPVEEQQAEQSLESVLSEEFDRQESEEIDSGEEMASSEEDGQEGLETDEEHEEGTEEDLEVSAEAEQAGVDDYNEPAPERWPEDIKQAYNSLPPAARKAMLEGVYKPMQRQYTQTTQELAQQRKQLDPMMQTLEQHAEQFKAAGINPVEAFQRQMAWSAHFARVGPEQGAKDLAEAYGQAGGQPDTPAESVYMTPVEKAQQAEIDRLKGEFSNLSKTEQQRQEHARQQAFEARQAHVQGTIARFANETKDGQPLHPHVEKVSGRMAGLIKGGLVDRVDEYGQPVPYEQQLGQAYQLACQMDPSIRTARRTQTRQEQVKKVSAASRDVVSKTPGHPDVQDDGPLADTISDLYDKLDRSAA